MKKKTLLSALLAAGMLAGCGSTQSDVSSTAAAEATAAATAAAVETAAAAETVSLEGLKVLAPTGAPALSLIPIAKEGEAEITTVDGADALQAAFVAPESEYDVIVAPTNLGTKLAQAEKTGYKLLAVVDWGNLYIVGSDEADLSDESKTLAVFGEEAVPGLVFKAAYGDEVKAQVTWLNSVTDARDAILAGNADAALLAEPAATVVIAKAKENGTELKVISNVEEKWGEGGFPMAGFFVNSETYEENKEKYDAMLETMAAYTEAANADASNVAADIDAVEGGAEFFGVPSSAIVSKCYSRLGLNITKASEAKDEIAKFMELFGVASIDKALAE